MFKKEKNLKTYFALHCITARNKDDNPTNLGLDLAGYNEKDCPKGEKPSKINVAQGQIDEPLIYKGRKQAESIALQIVNQNIKIKRIICGNQKRCKQTAEIIKEKLGNNIELIIEDRLVARNYGIIAEQKMDEGEMTHFWEVKKDSMEEYLTLYKTVALYLGKPELLGVEPKSDFEARVKSFFKENKSKLKNTLIIAGSDVYGYLAEKGSIFNFEGKAKENKLKRGVLSSVKIKI